MFIEYPISIYGVNVQCKPEVNGIRNYAEHWPHQLTETYGLEYDYCSIMHYDMKTKLMPGTRPQTCIVMNKRPVRCNIKGKSVNYLGQRLGLSEKDIVTIRRRYNCKGSY